MTSKADKTGYISHRESTNTYTLAFASTTPEDLLELLASVEPDGEYLKSLPASFLGSCPHRSSGSIYIPYLPYLPIVTEATDALSLLLSQDRSSYLSTILRSLISTFGYHTSSGIPEPRVEITGHGLGAVLALLSSIRQSTLRPDLEIKGKLFSMPLVGDRAFADSVDHLVLARKGRLDLQRVTNGRDPVSMLPPPHFGLQHPSSISELILAGERQNERSQRTINMAGSRLDDSHGPYDGVMIALVC